MDEVPVESLDRKLDRPPLATPIEFHSKRS